MSTQSVQKKDLETFLKVAQLSTPSSNPYLIIHDDKSKVTFSVLKKSKKEKATAEYEYDKVFNEYDEYSYIYENIATNCIQDAMNGINYSFISYGETLGEKHSLLYGGSDCHKNLNTRGIFPRLLESLIMKNNLQIEISVMGINSNKLIDITKFAKTNDPSIFKENSKNKLTANEILKSSFDIVQKPEVIDNISKHRIQNMDEIKSYLLSYNQFFAFLLGSENYRNDHTRITKSNLPITYFLYTFSTFIYVIYVNDALGKPISNITLCELPGNDQFTTQISNPTIEKEKNMYNTKAIIENTNTIENLKKALTTIKSKHSPDDLVTHDSISEASGFDAKLMIALKNLSFTKKNTQFRIMGCITPNTGMYESVKDTLNFLFDCRKITNPRKIDLEKELVNLDTANKDDVIYALEERCRIYMNKIKELNDIIEQKNDRNRNLQDTYHQQIEALKEAFNFKGDINVLLSGNQYTKEAKYAKKVREAFDMASVKVMQNTELEKKVLELEHELEKLRMFNDVRVNDQVMVNYYSELKEKNLNEQTKLKIHLEHSKEMNKIKEQNAKLIKMNSEMNKENEKKSKLIENFSKIINDKVNKNLEIAQIKQEISNEVDTKMKNEIKEYCLALEKEKKKFLKENNIKMGEKDKEIFELKSKLETFQTDSKKEMNKLLTETILLYELLMNLMNKYKKEFHSKSTQHLSPKNFTSFIIAKDNFELILAATEKNINMLNFPKTQEAISKNQGKILKKGNFKDLKLDPLDKMANNTFYNSNNTIIEMISSFEKQITELKKENESLKDQIFEMNNLSDSNKIVINKDENVELLKENEKNLMEDKNKLMKRLEEMVALNNKNKILINAQQRAIDKLNRDNILFKSSVLSTKKNFGSTVYPYMSKRVTNGSFDNKISNHNISTMSIGKGTNYTSKNLFQHRPQTGTLRKSASAKILK